MPDITSHSPTRRLIVLGSTGSIGENTLEVVAHLHACTKHRFDIVGLATGSNIERISQQAQQFGVRHIAVANAEKSHECSWIGQDAALLMIDKIAQPGDLVVAAMVGFAGLPAVVRAIEKGCDVALANKETLVAAGSIVMPLAREKGVHILPVDSEHSAIFQCLVCGRSPDEVRRIVLTASGGPFRNATPELLASATVEDALNHPTWKMGAKVTIDSATLMNKALEVIEAHWIFDLDAEQIDAVIHPQSIVHSFVEFRDGSIIAQLSPPDMKLPIQYALTWPQRADGCANRLDWTALSGLDFQQIDTARFPAIGMALDVVRAGGTAGATFNAANEIAVQAFFDEQIGFPRIFEIVAETMEQSDSCDLRSIDDVIDADRVSREIARAIVARECVQA